MRPVVHTGDGAFAFLSGTDFPGNLTTPDPYNRM